MRLRPIIPDVARKAVSGNAPVSRGLAVEYIGLCKARAAGRHLD